ncbi:MAG: NADH-quinone oxidoreductase subunit M [Candidatus Dormibacteraeota bacterium]|nr:NADH-quinone oxidoreductase subunit M [Candidatus Dormibacteraeota bacterium]
MNVPWLTLVIVIPVGMAILLQLVPRSQTALIKALMVGATATVAVIVFALLYNMAGSPAGGGPLSLHYQERHDWIPAIGASYHLGLDGLSGWLLALNAGVFLLGALAVSRRATDRLRFYATLLLLTEAATGGVLLSADLLLFYLFWEGMLIPLYFLLSNFGDENRGRNTLKFVIYTVAGSLLMLASIIWLYFNAHLGTGETSSFDLAFLINHPSASQAALVIPGVKISTFTPQQLVFIGFALAFAIKIPIVPFHTWLPGLYESSPPFVLVFFAGIVSKLGAYGFIRYGLTLFPQPIGYFKWVLAALAVLSIIYGALMALSERDIKRIVAYASISHLGFIALGIFSLTQNGVNGAIIQIINHGIIIAALFLIVGMIEARTGTRELHELSGLEKRMPWLYFLFLVATLAGLGMPGMNSFVGEFTIMLGAFQLNWIYAVLAGGGVILACWYMLRLHQGLMHDPIKPVLERVRDIRLGEALLLSPLVALMVFLGVYPRPVGDLANPSVAQYVSIATGANPNPSSSAPSAGTPQAPQ